jgi:acyl-CoA synthetase (AMP-forming)/AMP-acid ligase II
VLSNCIDRLVSTGYHFHVTFPANQQVEKENRICLYYLFEATALRLGNEECIWSREGCYTWTQTYNKVNQYGQWFLQQGVKPGDLVGFYLMNSPDFMFAWLGLWSIGAAPAMINYNLAGKALLHCLKISGTKLLLVDEEPALRARIEDVGAQLEGELAIKVIVVDSIVKAGISAMSDERPSDAYREVVKGDGHMCLFYTRYMILHSCCRQH